MAIPFVYNPNLELNGVVIDPDNERQTWYRNSFIGIRDSIRSRGVITPIGVEDIGYGNYKVIYGNTRTLAAKSSGHKTIRAKVYSGLSTEQRFRLQVIENSQKEKIPLVETAANLWSYYLYRLANESVGVYSESNLATYNSYWDLPGSARRVYSMADFSRRIGFSEDKVASAFRFINLHSDIKAMVVRRELGGKSATSLSYSFAQELGRITDKDEQVKFLSRVIAKDEDYNIGIEVSKYIRSKNFNVLFSLELSNGSASNCFDYGDLERRISSSTRVMGNIATLIQIDKNILNGTRGLIGDNTTSGDIFLSYNKEIERVEELLSANTGYDKVASSVAERGKSLKERILAGEFDIKGRTNDVLTSGEYMIVPIGEVYEDASQPRKTFNESKLASLASTINEVGILSPPLVKRTSDGKYRLIVGHRRTRASRIAGLKNLEVIVCNISDDLCREIQYEEDIFEKVVLAERADKLYKLYLLEKEKANSRGESLSIRQFAKSNSSLGANAVINAIMFAGLPYQVKAMHLQGLLKYSTAVAIAEYAEASEQIDWAIEASLSGYDSKKLRHKIFQSKTQMNMEDSNGLFGGGSIKTKGRRNIINRKVEDALDIVPEILVVCRKPKIPRSTIESILLLTQKYKLTREFVIAS